MKHVEIIEELPSSTPGAGRLGRHREWDDRNEQYLVRPPAAATDKGKLWQRRLGPLDQGNVGACTEFAFAGTCRTSPLTGKLSTAARKQISDPLALYSYETAHDEYPGAYPPDDTGSSVLAAMKTGVALNIIGGYQWATSAAQAQAAIEHVGPAECGIEWTEGFDRPDADGIVSLAGAVRGGHALNALGRIDTTKHGWLWVLCQSWGPGWPAQPFGGKPGHFAVLEADFLALCFDRGGELSFPQIS